MAWKNLMFVLCGIAIAVDAAAVVQPCESGMEKLSIDAGFSSAVDPSTEPDDGIENGTRSIPPVDKEDSTASSTPPSDTVSPHTAMPPTPPPDTVNPPRKITFDYSTKIDFDFQHNSPSSEVEFEVGSEEDEEASQWVVVTSSGYEYDGSPDILREIFIEANHSSLGSIDEMISQFGNPVLDDVNVENSGFDSRSKRKVFGADDRERVRNFHYPYSAMGQIDSSCTGTFVGPRHILTAGHCLYSYATQRWHNPRYFHGAKDCDRDEGTLYRIRHMLSVRGWTRSGLRAYDYGLVVVDRSSSSYMDIGYYSGSIFRWHVYMAGYPGDKPRNCLWRTSCRTSVLSTSSRLVYRCDTYAGMSGSGVYAYWDGVNRRRIICVHTGSGLFYNGCARITRTKYGIINRWIRDY